MPVLQGTQRVAKSHSITELSSTTLTKKTCDPSRGEEKYTRTYIGDEFVLKCKVKTIESMNNANGKLGVHRNN